MTAPRSSALVLVADDEDSIRFVLRQALESAGHRVEEARDGAEALERLAEADFDLAFLDIRMPEHTGLEVLQAMKAKGSETAAVIMTAQGTMDSAIEAMKQGALDYLAKPFSIDEATALTAKALRTRDLEREVRELRREVDRYSSKVDEDRMVGRSQALLDVFKIVGKVAASNISVLITGDSGTGKELVARAIHRSSPRATEAFIAVNAAAIPSELLESELFGHERGAFTGAHESRPGRFREASGGTLFLDEIGDMPHALQAKLLRVLQSGEITSVGGRAPRKVDVRIIAATHRDLDEAVLSGHFREDLLYRLRVVPIHLPPLRERLDDIEALAEHFADRYGHELAGEHRAIAGATRQLLLDYKWPGNVRELENAVKRAVVLSSGSMLTPEDFSFIAHPPAGADERGDLAALIRQEVLECLDSDDASDVYHAILEQIEPPLLKAVLERTDGNQLRAAALLGINRNTLRKKIVELKIEVPKRPTP
ncbi:MAG: sigma-54 dependent transcriptional regulator [Myxococcota bacterium]|jgi:two-component system nitrogen regulation response regulator GlnG